MRSRYLVSYDVRDPRRLRRTYRTMRGYGDALQYSVFQCDLSDQEKVKMTADLLDVIHEDEDRVMIVDLGPAEGRGRECFQFLGCRGPSEDSGAVVV